MNWIGCFSNAFVFSGYVVWKVLKKHYQNVRNVYLKAHSIKLRHVL